MKQYLWIFGLAFLLFTLVPLGAEEPFKPAKTIDELIEVLGNPAARGLNWEGTKWAIKELVAIGKPAVPKLLEAIKSKNRNMAEFSADVLEEIGQPALPQTRAKWPGLEEAQKWDLMNFLGRFDYQRFLDFTLASLDSKDEEVRRKAIEFLGHHKETKATKKLLKMLNEEKREYLRADILQSLTKIGGNEVADGLIPLLALNSWTAKNGALFGPEGDRNPWYPDSRVAIIWTLGKIKAKKAAPNLLEILKKEGTDKSYFGLFIIPLLAEWGYTEAVPELKKTLQEWKSEKEIVAKALLQLKDRTGVPILMKLLQSEEVEERRLACKAFSDFGTKSDLCALGQCLDDVDDGITVWACQGFERITGLTFRPSDQPDVGLYDVPLWKAWFQKNKKMFSEEK
jgi:HEAT repeat protein